MSDQPKGRDVTVGVAGATGAVGQEIVRVLDAAPWRPRRLVPMARASTEAPFVRYGDAEVPVDDLALQSMEDLDALILAVPREVAAEAVEAAVQASVPVVDVSGSTLEDFSVPLVVPWLHAADLDAPRTRDLFAVPSAPAILLATVLAPLAGREIEAEAQVLVPASAWGQRAVTELSGQVIALFNSSPPPRKVFPHGFAFDTLPQVGTPGATGWTDQEVRIMAELGRLLGLPTSVTLTGVPLFSGLTVHLSLGGEVPTPEELVRLLRDAGVEVHDEDGVRSLPRPRRLDGQPLPAVCRVRASPTNGRLHLEVVMDNLSAVATAAVGAMASLLRATDAS